MRLNTGPVATGRDNWVPDTRGPPIYVHIGEPKTGTTFLQDALWANRAPLAVQGLQLPGYSDRDHSRASRDLRETPRPASDPADPWTGEWEVLAGQALYAPERAVISNELLAASSPQQAERAVCSLLRAEVHVVATVRNFAALLPAEWQETVKCRGTVGWEPWLDAVIAAEGAADRRRRSWFWRVHDTLAILDMWSRHIPPDQVHVVTVPHQASGSLLWTRFAAAMDIDPGGCDVTGGRRNSSLGYAETEFLRRMNEALPADMPDWFYAREIKQILAHGALSDRPHHARLVLPPSHAAWAAEQAEILLAGLRDAKYDIVGELADLRPAREAGHAGGAGHPRPARAGRPRRRGRPPPPSPASRTLDRAAARSRRAGRGGPGRPLLRGALSSPAAAAAPWRAAAGQRHQVGDTEWPRGQAGASPHKSSCRRATPAGAHLVRADTPRPPRTGKAGGAGGRRGCQQ